MVFRLTFVQSIIIRSVKVRNYRTYERCVGVAGLW